LPPEKIKYFRGSIDKDTKVLKIQDRKGMDLFLETLTGEVEISIREVSSRTHHQNRYYWGPVLDTLVGSGYFEGYFKNEIHKTLKDRFNVPSTKVLTTSQFQEFLNEITVWVASEFGVIIPPPNDDFTL